MGKLSDSLRGDGGDFNGRWDAADVKSAANGRWTVLLPAVTGIDAAVLDEKRHPCPKCGGTDRFRCLDAETGALFCNQCFSARNGDGFAAIQWLKGCTFPEALQAVAESLNLPGSRNGHAANGKARESSTKSTAKPSTSGKAKPNDTAKGKPFATGAAAVAALCRMMTPTHGRPAGQWTYHDAGGRPVALVLRFNGADGSKEFRPVSLHGESWFLKGPATPRPLYGLPDLVAVATHSVCEMSRCDGDNIGTKDATTAATVYVCEGEKTADAARSLGLVAVTSMNGALSPDKTDWTPLAGKNVVILPDHDEAGRKYSVAIAAILAKLSPSPVVKIVELPELTDGDDLVEWIAAHGDAAEPDMMRQELERLVDEVDAVELEPDAPSGASDETTNLIDEQWPAPVDEAAYYGVAGNIVRKIAPHTEADPVAILIQVLVTVGNMIGRRAYFPVEATRHYANLFGVIVGASSVARKGTSGDQVSRVVRQADEDWYAQRTLGGLVSGEGLIWQVRDPIIKQEAVREGGKKDGKVIEYQDVIADPGVADKRLLVFESEFSAVLKAKGRDMNTLSETLRQAWDSGKLRTAAKNQPAKATDAHVSLVGHITAAELREVASQTDMTNGFANRFLWCCVRRSKLLPDGGQVDRVDFDLEISKLKRAVEFAGTEREVRRDDAAAEEWRRLYASLTSERPGAVGAICNRGAAQVVRLSLLYALLDCSPVVKVEHLHAALALWNYCEASVKYIFGHSLANRTADSILNALKSAGDIGVSRSDISNLFKRNKSKAELDAALQVLHSSKLARRELIPTGGRSVETWFTTA